MTKNARTIGTIGPVNVVERREAKRFRVDWAIKVLGIPGGRPQAEETGVLRDISSTGAYGLFTGPFEPGSAVTVMIQLPLRRHGWISYPARILRVEPWDSGAGIAFIFEAVRPSFVVTELDQQSSQ